MSQDIVLSSAMYVVKMLVILGLVLYALFAAVVMRQEHLMTSVLEEKSEKLLRILVLIHFLASVGTIVLAIFIL